MKNENRRLTKVNEQLSQRVCKLETQLSELTFDSNVEEKQTCEGAKYGAYEPEEEETKGDPSIVAVG